MRNLDKFLETVNSSKLTNNTQRVLVKLLRANGEWVSRSALKAVPSATSRVRDLRKQQYGAMFVGCASASDLNRRGRPGTFYYRVDPSKLTKGQLAAVLRLA